MTRRRLGVRTRLLLAVVGAVRWRWSIGVAAFNLLLDQRLADSATSLAKAQAAGRALRARRSPTGRSSRRRRLMREHG